MPYNIKLRGLTAKKETTYGTDAAPSAATDGVRVTEPLWTNLRIEHVFPGDRSDVANGSIRDEAQPAPRVGRMATIDVAWEARGAGATYVSNTPEALALFEAAGLLATLATDEYELTILDSGHSSATIYAYGVDGYLYKIVGARCSSLRWPIVAGQLGLIRFQLQGWLLETPSATALPAITYDATIPRPAAGMTFTVGAWAPDVFDAEFDLGIRLERLDGAGETEGIDEFAIAGFAPSLRLNARAVALATYDPYTDARTPTPRAIDVVLGAGGAYNQIQLTEAAAWVGDPEHPEDKGFAAWGLTYRLNDPLLAFRN